MNKSNNNTELTRVKELEDSLKQLMEQLKTLQDEQLKKEKKVEEYLDGWKRAQADLINHKRDEKERLEGFRKYVEVEVLKKMVLPLIDDLDRALEHIPTHLEKENWTKGVLAIRETILGTLKSANIVTFGAINESVDPQFHEVVTTEKSPEFKEKIKKVVARGFKTTDGFVIRPAKIITGE